MSRDRPSAAQRPVKVRRPAGRSPYRPAGRKSSGRGKKLAILAVIVVLLLAIGIGLLLWAYRLPQQEETAAPSQYRPTMSMREESSAPSRTAAIRTISANREIN